jgi:ankyrin repeat protein
MEIEYPLTTEGLINAANCGNLDQVKRIVESGINPNDFTELQALSYSCMHGDYDIAKYLLDNGACPNVYAFNNAIYYNNSNIVKLLLDVGADPNYEHNGIVPLIQACDTFTPNMDIIEMLLPVTNDKYYQLAYEYSGDNDLRDMIKRMTPHIHYNEPTSDFGGPIYKQYLHYGTPPDDPLAKQVFELIEIYINGIHPLIPYMLYNNIIMELRNIIDNRDSLYENGKLCLSPIIKSVLKLLFESNIDFPKNKYMNVYQIVYSFESEADMEMDQIHTYA